MPWTKRPKTVKARKRSVQTVSGSFILQFERLGFAGLQEDGKWNAPSTQGAEPQAFSEEVETKATTLAVLLQNPVVAGGPRKKKQERAGVHLAFCSSLLWAKVPDGGKGQGYKLEGSGVFVILPKVTAYTPPLLRATCSWPVIGGPGKNQLHTLTLLPGPTKTMNSPRLFKWKAQSKDDTHHFTQQRNTYLSQVVFRCFAPAFFPHVVPPSLGRSYPTLIDPYYSSTVPPNLMSIFLACDLYFILSKAFISHLHPILPTSPLLYTILYDNFYRKPHRSFCSITRIVYTQASVRRAATPVHRASTNSTWRCSRVSRGIQPPTDTAIVVSVCPRN
ncbi:uncharacterized protein CLUP02_05439 [Colletotrichum lupini]|uniref:Uncharacterized protein n=1 Tax=Colletotrichum lupini TaxID=145971 RepID=A0A9Q8WDQ0_9PEZI|nr:uncharacterized protein CLUP02_05439 [Colletotrichum lupini]UQC79958.1 hypothetical protein CLUP02_05439 [Colletotrichum lupini]